MHFDVSAIRRNNDTPRGPVCASSSNAKEYVRDDGKSYLCFRNRFPITVSAASGRRDGAEAANRRFVSQGQVGGAPRRSCDLDEPICGDSFTAAVRFAHLIRARFTFGDLLSECEWLEGAAVAILRRLV